mgnify:CR=1 FL=1
MSLLDPRRHQPARQPVAPPLASTPPTESDLLRLDTGARGWSSAGVSVVIRRQASARDLRDAVAVIEAVAMEARA